MIKADPEGPENKELLKNATEIKNKETLNINENNQLWNAVKAILTENKNKNFQKAKIKK